MSQLKTCPRQRGFSMLEIPIALFVCMVGMLGLFGMTLTLINTTSVSRNLTVANELAREELEQIKAMNYSNVTSQAFPAEDFGTISGFESFSRNVIVTDDSPDQGTKTVLVQVSWIGELDKSTKSTGLATILSSP